MSIRVTYRYSTMPTTPMLFVTSMQWRFSSITRIAGESVKLRIHIGRTAVEKLIDPRSKVFMHAAGWVEMVSPHGPIPLADIPLLETVLGRRSENAVKKGMRR